MKIEKASLEGVDYYYYGSPIIKKRKRIIFYFSGKIEKRFEKSIIKSAVEASAHGFDILANGCYRARKALNLPLMYLGGRMDVVIYPSLDNFRLDDSERTILLSSGSFLSFTEKSAYSLKSFMESSVKMLSFADKLIFIGKVQPYLATEALDRGLDVAVLKDFLYEESVRRFVSEGAAAIDTFSSWLSYPKYMAYEEYADGKCYLRLMEI